MPLPVNLIYGCFVGQSFLCREYGMSTRPGFSVVQWGKNFTKTCKPVTNVPKAQVIIGVREPGEKSFVEQRATLLSMAGSEVLNHTKMSPKFVCEASPSDFVVFPFGFLYMSYAVECTTSIRWPFSRSWVRNEKVVVNASAVRFMESVVGLSETLYKTWSECLRQ